MTVFTSTMKGAKIRVDESSGNGMSSSGSRRRERFLVLNKRVSIICTGEGIQCELVTAEHDTANRV